MSNWPKYLFHVLELTAAICSIGILYGTAAFVVPEAMSLPAPWWAWAWITAPLTAAVVAVWADLPRWAGAYLNWRAETIAWAIHRFGIPHTPTDDAQEVDQ